MLEENERNSKAAYVIGLFEDILSAYSSENNDVVFLINKYKSIIEDSDELTNDDKDIVYSALSTALYSFNYWNMTISE